MLPAPEPRCEYDRLEARYEELVQRETARANGSVRKRLRVEFKHFYALRHMTDPCPSGLGLERMDSYREFLEDMPRARSALKTAGRRVEKLGRRTGWDVSAMLDSATGRYEKRLYFVPGRGDTRTLDGMSERYDLWRRGILAGPGGEDAVSTRKNRARGTSTKPMSSSRYQAPQPVISISHCWPWISTSTLRKK